MMVLLKKHLGILNNKLPNIVNQKRDFGDLNKSEQTKYLAYFFVKITNHKVFTTGDISPLFTLISVDQPLNVRDLLNKMRERGILIPAGSGFSFHRDTISQLDEEFNFLLIEKKGAQRVSKLRLWKIYPEIINVSEKLFINGHYGEAIFNAFKKVEILVKNKSGIKDLTGHPLMQKVFSVKTPILKFNDLISQTNRDEQQGMMELFAGAMLGIRNPKAHDEAIQKDPVKTLEYLAFASLLCRRLEESKK